MRDLTVGIEERKKEAKRRGISDKAILIAVNLGAHERVESRELIRDIFKFEEENLLVEYQSGEYKNIGDGSLGFSRVAVRFGKFSRKEVFYEGGFEVRSYIPGKWEQLLSALVPKAKKAEKKRWREAAARRSEERKRTEDAEKKKWGL